MPKKRQVTFKKFESSSSQHNSNASAQNGSNSSVDGPVQTVNQRLSALRILPSVEANIKKQQLADQANQRSIPPHLRGILGVPESAPPRPKLAVRYRDRMRTPGPPPPRSWLGFEPVWQPKGPNGKRKKGRSADEAERRRPESLLRFQKMTGEIVNDGVGSGRLLHMTLKRMAQSWEMLEEDDYPALLDVPLRLRLRLLSYLGVYGPTIDGTVLQALTQGNEAVTSLDLGGLAGHGPLSLKRVAKVIGLDQLTTKMNDTAIADSWDAAPSVADVITSAPSISRFSDLTRLCLSHPPATVLWQDLLNLSKHTPQVTHLSIAYWPRPTLTPNLTTATVAGQHGPTVNAGGSNLYSTIESDREEPAALLKQLSSHTLCLQWLDLEGCADWSPALSLPIEQAILSPLTPSHPGLSNEEDYWSRTTPSATTIFCDTWKNVAYINFAQSGPLPTLVGIEAQPPGRGQDNLVRNVHNHVLQRDHEQRIHSQPPSRDIYDVERRTAAMWLDSERKLHATALHIHTIRGRRKMDIMVSDFGWRKVKGTTVWDHCKTGAR